MLIPLLALPRLILPHISSPAIIWSRGLPITRAKTNKRSIHRLYQNYPQKTASSFSSWNMNITREFYFLPKKLIWYAQTQFISYWLWLVEALQIKHHVPAFFSRQITRNLTMLCHNKNNSLQFWIQRIFWDAFNSRNVGKLKLLSPTNLHNYTQALSSFYWFLPGALGRDSGYLTITSLC